MACAEESRKSFSNMTSRTKCQQATRSCLQSTTTTTSDNYIVSTSITRLQRVPSARTIWSWFAMNSGRTTPIIVALSTMTVFISKRTPNLDESTFPCVRCTHSFEDISQTRLRSTWKMSAISSLSHRLLSTGATVRCSSGLGLPWTAGGLRHNVR